MRLSSQIVNHAEYLPNLKGVRLEIQQLRAKARQALSDDEVDGHRFEMGRRSSYAYSDELRQTERGLKDLKARERLNGSAYVETDRAFSIARGFR